MTVEDIKKYAIEKRLPKRAVDELVQRLSEDYPGDIDNRLYLILLAEIDRSAEYWEGVRHFLDWSKKEREERKRRKNK